MDRRTEQYLNALDEALQKLENSLSAYTSEQLNRKPARQRGHPAFGHPFDDPRHQATVQPPHARQGGSQQFRIQRRRVAHQIQRTQSALVLLAAEDRTGSFFRILAHAALIEQPLPTLARVDVQELPAQ